MEANGVCWSHELQDKREKWMCNPGKHDTSTSANHIFGYETKHCHETHGDEETFYSRCRNSIVQSTPSSTYIYIWYPKNFLHSKPGVAMEPALSCLSVAAGCGTVMTPCMCPCTYPPIKSLIILIVHHAFSSSWKEFPNFPLSASFCYSACDGLRI